MNTVENVNLNLPDNMTLLELPDGTHNIEVSAREDVIEYPDANFKIINKNTKISLKSFI